MSESLQYKSGSIRRARAFRKDMTDGEQKIWSRLRRNQLGCYFRRQMPIGKYIVDFACWKERLIVEIDGSQHLTKEGKKSDQIRDTYLKGLGFRILRFNSVESLNNTDGVVDLIYEKLKNPPKRRIMKKASLRLPQI